MVCEAFGCTPSQALHEDPTLVFAVLDYRLALAAKDQHKVDATKMTPGMAHMLASLAEVLKERQGDEED